jgi:hypothetical protein
LDFAIDAFEQAIGQSCGDKRDNTSSMGYHLRWQESPRNPYPPQRRYVHVSNRIIENIVSPLLPVESSKRLTIQKLQQKQQYDKYEKAFVYLFTS